MRSVSATKFNRKSGGAKPTCPGAPWRDLQFRGPFLETRNLVPPQNCHLDRSEAEWRDLRFLFGSHAGSKDAALPWIEDDIASGKADVDTSKEHGW